MKTGGRRIFKDLNKLQEMLLLRSQGWSLLKLAKYFGCDHTSILYHCHHHYIRKERSGIINVIKNKLFKKKGFCRICGIRLKSYYAGKSVGDLCESCFKDKPVEKNLTE